MKKRTILKKATTISFADWWSLIVKVVANSKLSGMKSRVKYNNQWKGGALTIPKMKDLYDKTK